MKNTSPDPETAEDIAFQKRVDYWKNKASEILKDGLQKFPKNTDIIFSLAECYSRKKETLEVFKPVSQKMKLNEEIETIYRVKAGRKINGKIRLDEKTANK